MELNEKMKIFNDAVMEAATRQGEEIIEDSAIRFDQQARQYRAQHIHQQKEMLKREMQRQERENNRLIAQEARNTRKGIFEEQEKLKKQIFMEVENHLYQFMRGDGYEAYLLEQVQKIVTEYGQNAQVYIYLNRTDAGYQKILMEKRDVEVRIAANDLLGGIIAEIPEKNIRIDESFRSRKEQEWETFHF